MQSFFMLTAFETWDKTGMRVRGCRITHEINHNKANPWIAVPTPRNLQEHFLPIFESLGPDVGIGG